MPAAAAARWRTGWMSATILFVALAGVSLWIDPVDVRRTAFDPTATPGFQSDEATYYLMGHSLAKDFDLEYRHEDIIRTRAEFPGGPNGVFLKRGVTRDGQPDPVQDRLYFGKSFIYPLFAAPFVRAFGTNGFYVFNSLLLALGFLCAYLFLSARASISISLVMAGGFLFPTVVPVYWSWIAPELLNCIVGLIAYFWWLYKFVAPPATSRWVAWLRGPASDVVAALLVGLLCFSKPTNALLGLPMGLWWLWRREWTRAALVAVAFVVAAGAGWGSNMLISGDWNYQGGAGAAQRETCYGRFPFETAGDGLDVCSPRETSEALTEVWFDRDMFWHNMRANLGYYVVGRYGGLLPYFFPAVLGVVVMLARRREIEGWQWLVLAGIVIQIGVFLVTLPYTWFGGGGSVGNRYFMGVYGAALFLFPPVRSRVVALLLWIVGGLFMWPLVISPFDTSMRPGDRAFSGPLRLLPVERTNYQDLPVQTEGELMRRWFGETTTNPGFQILYLDKNSWLQETDKLSFWTRGDSHAELLVRTNNPESRIEFHLSADDVAVRAYLALEGERASVSLAPWQRGVVQFALPPGFRFKDKESHVSYIWHLSITTEGGFVPLERSGLPDSRFLGVRVKPLIVRSPAP
jgi:hypothetical protein